ncbi:MAG: chromosome segregation protein SMC, partial [Paraclostridium sp.]
KGVINKKYSELSVLNEKIINCESDIKRHIIEITNINEKLGNNEAELLSLEKNKENAFVNLNNIKSEIDEVQLNNKNKKSNISELAQEVENLKDEIINLLDMKQNSANKLSTLNANIENIEKRTENINLDIKIIETNISNKKGEIRNYNLDKEEKLKLIEKLRKDYSELSSSINSLKEEYKNLDNNIQGSKLKLNEYNSKLNIYIDMEKHYEGFNKGVKEVLKNKNLEGIYGALGQVISSSKEYEKALEASLGSYMQNIITKDEISAKAAINYLKKNNLGRVTFLPLNIIKSNKIDEKMIKSSTNYIAVASDLVKFEEKYKNIVENVLGRTIVINNMDEAIKFARETNHRYKVVTLDGEILNPGGSLTGGTIRTNGNILSRKRIIEEFQEKLISETASLKSLEQSRLRVQDNINLEVEKLESIKLELSENDKNLIFINTSMKSLNDEMINLENNLSKLHNENKSLGENLEYTLTKTSSLKDEISKIEEKHLSNKSNIDKLNIKLKESNNIYEVDKNKFDDLNLEHV